MIQLNFKHIFFATVFAILFLIPEPEYSSEYSINESISEGEDLAFNMSPRRRRKPKIRMRLLKTDSAAPGIVYKKYKIGNRKEKLLIHVIEADLSDSNNIMAIMKAENSSYKLEKVHDMIMEYDSTHDYHVVGAVNGSYWKAYHQYPIGPTVVEGEVVELNNHRSWNSAYFDDTTVYIDRFRLFGRITTADGAKYELVSANRRKDTTGLVIYNSFAGDTLPVVTHRSLKKAFESALEDSIYSDITEQEFDTLKFKQYLLDMERDSSDDFTIRKVRMQYLDKPAVNKEIQCVVLSIDTGVVAMPENGCILTLGDDIDSVFIAEPGDTMKLKYYTNIMKDKIFTGALLGTPRMMVNGRSRFEGKQRQGRGRFKYKELSRTGIGISKDHKKLYLITSSHSSKKYGIKGCTLENFAYAMKRLRIYNAINLDGGGSTVMVLNGRNPMSCPYCSRRVSVSVGVARRDSADKNDKETKKPEEK